MSTAATMPLPPGLRRMMVTTCCMTATIMQALDTTIANIALPHMQGSLSASLDQITWTLTSYIVASAIMTAPMGWLADRFGRKKLFIVCVAGFTVASLLCGISQNVGQIVTFRIMQGMFGAALVPLSQSVILDAYPFEQRGHAMAVWSVGVMLGPIMGPTLGGWLTENYSWHWVFLVNLPVGIFTILGLLVFMDETQPRAHLRFDWFGFIALAIGIGALQLMLDRGEQVGWFESPEIIAELIISIAGFYFFFTHSLTTDAPFVRFALFKDRNFIGGCIFMVVIGMALFGTMALVVPYMQNVMGYPVLTAGWMLGSRGVGTLLTTFFCGYLLRHVEARWLVLIGMLVTTATIGQMIGFTNETSQSTIVTVTLVQGMGLGMVFVPLSTVAFATLPAHLRTDGTAILTLVRNIGSSVGISVVIANLTSTTTAMHARLTEQVTPFNDALKMPDVRGVFDLTTERGLALLEELVRQQATIIAFANDFKLLMWMTLAALPLIFVIGSSRTPKRVVGGAR
jgi:MFS transporter, DHA2 family, multidrug resistance protein